MADEKRTKMQQVGTQRASRINGCRTIGHCIEQERIFTKFKYVIAHGLIPGLNIFQIFSANRKSAMLDFLRDFQIYEHMFEYFRMHKKL